MPFSTVLFIVSILMVIGIISVTEGILRIFIKAKNPPDTILIKVTDEKENLDLILRDILRKYPFSKLQIESEVFDDNTKKLLDVIKKDYPEIKINLPE